MSAGMVRRLRELEEELAAEVARKRGWTVVWLDPKTGEEWDRISGSGED